MKSQTYMHSKKGFISYKHISLAVSNLYIDTPHPSADRLSYSLPTVNANNQSVLGSTRFTILTVYPDGRNPDCPQTVLIWVGTYADLFLLVVHKLLIGPGLLSRLCQCIHIPAHLAHAPEVSILIL